MWNRIEYPGEGPTTVWDTHCPYEHVAWYRVVCSRSVSVSIETIMFTHLDYGYGCEWERSRGSKHALDVLLFCWRLLLYGFGFIFIYVYIYIYVSRIKTLLLIQAILFHSFITGILHLFIEVHIPSWKYPWSGSGYYSLTHRIIHLLNPGIVCRFMNLYTNRIHSWTIM